MPIEFVEGSSLCPSPTSDFSHSYKSPPQPNANFDAMTKASQRLMREMGSKLEDMKQHITYSHDAIVDGCQASLRALIAFEAEYEKRITPLALPSELERQTLSQVESATPPERLRTAMGNLLSLRSLHQLTLEGLEAFMAETRDKFAKIEQMGMML